LDNAGVDIADGFFFRNFKETSTGFFINPLKNFLAIGTRALGRTLASATASIIESGGSAPARISGPRPSKQSPRPPAHNPTSCEPPPQASRIPPPPSTFFAHAISLPTYEPVTSFLNSTFIICEMLRDSSPNCNGGIPPNARPCVPLVEKAPQPIQVLSWRKPSPSHTERPLGAIRC